MVVIEVLFELEQDVVKGEKLPDFVEMQVANKFLDGKNVMVVIIHGVDVVDDWVEQVVNDFLKSLHPNLEHALANIGNVFFVDFDLARLWLQKAIIEIFIDQLVLLIDLIHVQLV